MHESSYNGSVGSHTAPWRHAKASFAWHAHCVSQESDGTVAEPRDGCVERGTGSNPPSELGGHPLGDVTMVRPRVIPRTGYPCHPDQEVGNEERKSRRPPAA
jgi:hypothetical protein